MLPKKSKKTSSNTRKKNTKTTSLSAEEEVSNAIPRAEKINIEHLLLQAFERYSKQQTLIEKDKQKELKHLVSIIEEYLSGYFLIGYTLEDEQVVVFNASTPKDEAALIDLLRTTFIEIISNRP